MPFTAGYRPIATGLGTVALELLVAVAITNALRRRIPHRLWRATHYLGFAVWAAATVHGICAGSDRRDVWLLALYVASIAAVLAGLVYRTSASRPQLGQAIGFGLVAGAVVVGVVAALPAARSPSAHRSPRGSFLRPTRVRRQPRSTSRRAAASRSSLSTDTRPGPFRHSYNLIFSAIQEWGAPTSHFHFTIRNNFFFAVFFLIFACTSLG